MKPHLLLIALILCVISCSAQTPEKSKREARKERREAKKGYNFKAGDKPGVRFKEPILSRKGFRRALIVTFIIASPILTVYSERE